MTGKQSGLGDNFYIGGYDLSGDLSSVDQISGPFTPFDVTGINKFANERTAGGLRTGDWQFTSFFDFGGVPNPVFEHDALSPLPRTDTIASYFRGTALGNPAACILGKQINYDGTRDNTGNLTLKVEVQANGFGTEWGLQATPGLRPDTGPTHGTALDNGTATTFGAQAYLQLIALTGTNVDVVVEHSADNTTFTTLVDFGSQTARGAVRGAATGTVNRYVRVSSSGTFTSAKFGVAFMRNPVAVKF